MAGCVQHFEHHLAHFKSFAIVQTPGSVAELGPRAGKELNLRARSKFADAAHVIIVLMGIGKHNEF